MKIHHLDSDHALASLHTRAGGLTRAEAEARLREFGANRVATAARTSPWRALPRHLTHFFALLLWIAAALAGLAEVRDPGHGMATLAWAIVGVIVVNALFSWLQEARAQRALDALQRMLPHRVNVLRDGAAQTLDATELVPGDIVLLTGGDEVPADCRVLEAFGARVNTATVTGESRPQTRHAQPVTDERLIDARNVVLAGTTLLAGELRAVVFATGMHTEFGRIAHLTQTTAKDISPLQREIERLSRWIALFAVALGALFFAIGTALGTPFWVNLVFAVGIIVANVPEGLLPTVTLALAMGAQRMARRNALIRRLPSVETLGSTTVICTDKTGTLTENRLRVAALYADGRDLDAAQLSANNSRALHLAGDIAAHCHNLAAANTHGDPLERALVEFARGVRPTHHLQPRVDEIPFDSDRRRMSTVHRADGGHVVYTKGALDVVLPRCSHVMADGAARPLDASRREALLAAEDAYAQRGLRVIALAWRELPDRATGDIEQDLTLIALAALHDPPRPEVPRAIQQCRDAGIRVVMVTGDHPRTAVAVARSIGLINSASPHVIIGSELERLSDTQLQLALDRPELLFARIGADQKRRIVAALKRKGEVVAVTGDGVNDAPALKEAHIGIAMGRSGTDVAKECADVVLLDDNFATIVAAIEEGRAVFDNIRKFLTYILTSNIPEIVPYLAWGLFAIPLPLTVIQILAVDLGTDLLPALALGAERADPQTMRRPPRRRSQRLIDGALIARAYLFLGIFEAAAALAAFLYLLNTGGWSYGDPLPSNDPLYLQATTACLAAIVLMQIVNVWLCRSGTRALWQLPLFNNPLILLGIASELVLLAVIVYTPWGQAVFGTAMLDVNVLLFVAPFAIAMWLAEELRKAWVRAHPK